MDKQKIIIKLLSIVLVMTMFLSNAKIMGNTVIEVAAESGDFFNGDGNEDNPYQISTAEQLNNVRKYLGKDTYFELINDINLEEFIAANDPINGWLPIGDYFNNFNGHFDGAGYTITGLWINNRSESFVGLFSCINNGSTISNLGVEINEKGVIGESYVGGLVGSSRSLCSIINSYVTGIVNGTDIVGGLAGYSYGSITTSYTTANVSGNEEVGGLVGSNSGSLTNSYATGDVSGSQNIGGLVGFNGGDSITTSYATGSVSGQKNVGGLVGENHGEITISYATGDAIGSDVVGGLVGDSSGSIETSYATGSVSGDRSSYKIGGLVGLSNGGTINSSYFDTDTTNQTNAVGGGQGSGTEIIGLTTAEMTSSNTLDTSGRMSGLGNAWIKRATTDEYCYYPELSVFYNDGGLDTKSKRYSEKSARVERINLSGGTVITTELKIIYGTKIGEIETVYTISDTLSIAGSMNWVIDNETIPNVADSDKSYTGTFIPNDDLYKSVENVSVTIKVTPMVITIMPTENQSKEYGASDPTFEYTASEPLIKGNTITGKLSRTIGETVGTYDYALGSLVINENFDLLLDETNKFEITKVTSEITLEATPTSGEASYGEDNVTLNVTVNNTNTSIETESPTGTITVTVDNGIPQAYGLTNGSASLQLTLGVGKHTIEVDYSGDGYYKSGKAIINNYDVNKANQEKLTITNIPETITYGDTFNLTTEGGSGEGNTTWSITEGDNYATINSSGNVTITGVGTIKVKATKASDDNYNGAYAETTFTSNKKEVSITGMTVNNKEYDGTIEATINSIGTIDGLLTSDQGYVSIDTTSYTTTFEDKNVGVEKTVTINNLLLTGAKAGNYKLNSTSYKTTTTITPKELTLKGVTVQDKVYDATTTATISNQGTLNGILGNDQVSIDTVKATFEDSNVGTDKTIGVTITTTGKDSGNYTIITPTDIKASMTPKTLTIKPDSNQSKNYGEVDPILTYQVTGLIEGDTIEFMGTLERTTGEEKGTYAINQGSLISANSNYSIQFSDGVIFTINAKENTPTTGDNRQISWIGLLSLSFLVIIVINNKKRNIGE